MNLDIPVRVLLDPERNVTNSLLEDAPIALIDLQENFAQTACGKTIQAAGELLVSCAEPLARHHRIDAFYSGAAVVGASFVQAEVTEKLKTRTLKLFSLTSPLCSVLSIDDGGLMESFENIAKKGHAMHPEMREATEAIMDYFAEISQQPSMARVAFCGAGYMAEQLDTAWRRTRSLELDGLWHEAVRDIPDEQWQEFLDGSR